jgi:branched-chain amino acid transport system substrate-binding protein
MNKSYALDLADYFYKFFSAYGGTIAGRESFSGNETNFTDILAKVAAAKPDVVVLPDYYAVVNLVTAQAKKLGITATFIGGDGWDSRDLDLAAADGSFFTNHFSPTDNRPEVQTFVISYGQHYKDENGNPKVPDAQAALAYDAANILLESIQAAGIDDPERVKEVIASGKFNAVTGFITFDAFHTPVKPVTIVHITGGKAVFYTQVPAE